MWDIDGIILTGEKPKVLDEKPFPARLFPPQTPHSVARDKTQAFAAGGRQLTALGMAQPFTLLIEL